MHKCTECFLPHNITRTWQGFNNICQKYYILTIVEMTSLFSFLSEYVLEYFCFSAMCTCRLCSMTLFFKSSKICLSKEFIYWARSWFQKWGSRLSMCFLLLLLLLLLFFHWFIKQMQSVSMVCRPLIKDGMGKGCLWQHSGFHETLFFNSRRKW